MNDSMKRLIVPLLAIVAWMGASGDPQAASQRWQGIGIGLACIVGLLVAGRWLLNPLFRILAASKARREATGGCAEAQGASPRATALRLCTATARARANAPRRRVSPPIQASNSFRSVSVSGARSSRAAHEAARWSITSAVSVSDMNPSPVTCIAHP